MLEPSSPSANQNAQGAPHPAVNPSTEESEDSIDVRAHESRNLLALAGYQIVVRIGWIFKTESIIMPAFLDLIGGQAWLRGLLPMLNRFGHSVPPMLFSRRLKMMRHKRWALLAAVLVMSAVFATLAVLWALGRHVSPTLFLVLYGVFFISVGINQLAFSTLQGKLIRAVRRGRLLLLSNTLGALLAVGFAWWLLRDWLAIGGAGFQYVFAFTAGAFALASLAMLVVVEPADNHHEPAMSPWGHFSAAARILKADVSFRRLAIVAVLFGVLFALFPHYQALAREKIGAQLPELMWWVVVQNLGTAVFSLVAGPLADARGNRLVLRFLMPLAAAAPLAALALVAGGDGFSRTLFPFVFVLIGLTPVTVRTLINYTLELSPTAEHPRYLATLSLCVAAPILLSPLVGGLVDLVGFEPVFLAGAALVILGWLLTFRLVEPRHAPVDDGPSMLETLGEE